MASLLGASLHEFLVPLLCTLTVVAVVAAFWVRSRRSSAIPSLPFAGVLGHLDWVIGLNRHVLMLEAVRKYGPVLIARVATEYTYFVTDGEMLKQLLPHCENKPVMYQKIAEVGVGFPRNLFSTLGGEQAKSRRKAFRHGFSPSGLRNREEHLITLVHDVYEVLHGIAQNASSSGSNSPVDLRDVFLRFSTDLIFKIAFDFDLGALRGNLEAVEYIKASDILMGPTPLAIAGFPPLKYATFIPAVREVKRSFKYCANFNQRTYDIFCKRYENASEQEKIDLENTTMCDIMKFHKANSDCSPHSEIALFVGAGYETSAHCLVWILHDLMRHPQIMEQLVDQLDKVIDAEGYDAILKSTTTIPLLEACIKESLRLHAPVPAALRVVTTTSGDGVDLGNGVRIPEGAQIAVSMYAVHRWERNWVQPDEYIPERWLQASQPVLNSESKFFDSGVKQEAITYLPFFSGSRMCIGEHLALLAIRTVLKAMLPKFHFAPTRDGEDIGESGVTFRPTWAKMVYLTLRNAEH